MKRPLGSAPTRSAPARVRPRRAAARVRRACSGGARPHRAAAAHARSACVAIALPLLACGNDGGPSDPPGGADAPPARLERVADGLDSPVHLTAAPGDDTRLFVTEQDGRVRVIRDGELLASPFLDLTDLTDGGGERGLLSIAFHPDYATSGRFFVSYTNRSGDTRIVEYARGASPDAADPTPVATILAVDQPYGNHNGGLIVFGPDGYLYVGLGDGGDAGDPHGNGQNLGTLLGTILRLDVDGDRPYEVPADNPFVGEAGAREEIWAYGLRNPWRFSFDAETDRLYIADVGQREWEEVDVAEDGGPGANYGWNIMEGRHCYQDDDCATDGLVQPVHEYDHDAGCSITGGFVYRGSAIPELVGHYVFSDYCNGRNRSFRYEGGEARDLREWGEVGHVGAVTSFGVDNAGELYVTTAEGAVYRIVPG